MTGATEDAAVASAAAARAAGASAAGASAAPATASVAVRPGSIGILGGTFDPFHVGHLALARAARDQLGLERVLVVPAAVPPHKQDRAILPGPVRLGLVEAGIVGEPRLETSTIELEREGPSWTVDTVEALAAAERAAGREPDLTVILSANRSPAWRPGTSPSGSSTWPGSRSRRGPATHRRTQPGSPRRSRVTRIGSSSSTVRRSRSPRRRSGAARRPASRSTASFRRASRRPSAPMHCIVTPNPRRMNRS